MTYRDWLPSFWTGEKQDGDNPFLALRSQMNRMFDEFDRGLPQMGNSIAVRSNVSETDDEICVTAELPGMEEKDIDVSLVGNQLVIKGEKKSETEEKSEEKGRQFHRVERSSGFFQRSMALPFDVKDEAVDAIFKNGVLTVTVKKPAEVKKKTKKISVKSAG